MAWRTSNSTLSNQITNQGAADFKAVNNLLTLQENHVEEFFTYHGEQFLTAMEKLLEDITQRVVSQLLVKLRFAPDTNNLGELKIHPETIREYDTINEANIQLDLAVLLGSALNSEVIMQRKMAKAQYLESQGFATQLPVTQNTLPTGYPQPYQPQSNAGGLNPSEISGGNSMVQANNMMMQQQQAFNNPSGYPIEPAGYDTMGNPYWMDPATGQASYTPPGSGLGLGNIIQKGAAWAAWLA